MLSEIYHGMLTRNESEFSSQLIKKENARDLKKGWKEVMMILFTSWGFQSGKMESLACILTTFMMSVECHVIVMCM